MTDAAFPPQPDPQLGADDFHRTHSLEELLAGAEPLRSVEELAIVGLSDDEADAFVAAIEG